jgi:hypothetical protein
VLQALQASPTRTFAAEHTVYWRRLYAASNATVRASIRTLVAAGQLEFAGGGWVQTDEATPWFGDTVDMYALGHQWLAAALSTPDHAAHAPTAWQADPFGHSAGHGAVCAGMAVDGFVFGRPASSGE